MWLSTYFFDEIYDFCSLGFFSVLGGSRLFLCFCVLQSCVVFIQTSAFFLQSSTFFIQTSAFFWQSCANFFQTSASYVCELSVGFDCLCFFSFLGVSLGLEFVYLWGWHYCSLVCEYWFCGLLFHYFYTWNCTFSIVKWWLFMILGYICNTIFSTVLYSFKSKIYSNTKLGVIFLPHYIIRRCLTDDFYWKGN